MKKILPVSIIVLTFIHTHFRTIAQDIHFTQFYASPLTLNPANTGLFDGKFRGAINYRNQWASVIPDPYVTMSGSVDMNMQQKIADFGIGLVLFNDKSGSGNLTGQSFMLSGAVRKKIGNKHQLSFGLQGGINQKIINYSALTFNNQITADATLDYSRSSNEKYSSNSTSYPDFHTGLLWNMSVSNQFSVYAGISIFHITQPKETFFSNGENHLNSRKVFHGGATYAINSKTGVNPNFILMSQNKAQEFLIGSDISYRVANPLVLFGGVWFRHSFGNGNTDAALPTVAMQYKKLRGGVSFDVNVSSLKSASHANGGPELSLIYILDIQKSFPVKKTLPCITF